ncbi:MAG: hypothetical protein R3F61_02585 [Myxococcota bacterium]
MFIPLGPPMRTSDLTHARVQIELSSLPAGAVMKFRRARRLSQDAVTWASAVQYDAVNLTTAGWHWEDAFTEVDSSGGNRWVQFGVDVLNATGTNKHGATVQILVETQSR